MARKNLVTDNWVLPRIDGETDRFQTYADASNAKRRNPTIYSRTADIKFSKPE